MKRLPADWLVSCGRTPPQPSACIWYSTVSATTGGISVTWWRSGFASSPTRADPQFSQFSGLQTSTRAILRAHRRTARTFARGRGRYAHVLPLRGLTRKSTGPIHGSQGERLPFEEWGHRERGDRSHCAPKTTAYVWCQVALTLEPPNAAPRPVLPRPSASYQSAHVLLSSRAADESSRRKRGVHSP